MRFTLTILQYFTQNRMWVARIDSSLEPNYHELDEYRRRTRNWQWFLTILNTKTMHLEPINPTRVLMIDGVYVHSIIRQAVSTPARPPTRARDLTLVIQAPNLLLHLSIDAIKPVNHAFHGWLFKTPPVLPTL
jgi:hypothetical protein